jgi:peptidoglycan/LPS O-acetylase OafA/YrhL
MIRLGEVVEGRDNNVRVLRHAAALAVILFHCFALRAHWADDPLARVFPGNDLGALGVQIFFALSGFLVAQSYLHHHSLRAYVIARALRIYPALLIATLFTIIVAGLSTTLRFTDYLGNRDTLEYLWRTSTGYESSHRLPEVFVANPYPREPNGSLWTLPVELRLYVAIGLMGVAGILQRRRIAAILTVAAILLLVYSPWPFSFLVDSVLVRKLAIIFACGALASLWRDIVPLSIPIAIVALAIYLLLPLGFTRAVVTLPLITYATLVAAFHPRLRIRRLARGGDISYGLYVYAFPVQQLFLFRWPGLGSWQLFAIVTPLIAGIALLSWRWIERPALALKSRLDDSTPKILAPHLPGALPVLRDSHSR